MRIIYILIICSLIGTIALWLGHFGKTTKRTAVLTCLASLSIAGVLLLLAVLPGNSFYGKVLTHAQNTQDRKLIALTFDDGPYPPYTQKLLALLEQKNVHATFFMVGENAAKHPDIVRKVQVQGHQIALHAGRHQDLLKLNAEEAASNIAYGKKTLESITHKPVHYMRPPHGFKDWSVVQAINSANLEIVNWSIIPRDWTNPGAQVIANRVCEAAAPGAIVLLHDGDSPKMQAPRDQTIEATGIIIDTLRAQGYEFVTIEDL
jgi:peptidoglycan-N-acetylglucosamine deacetylase